jgi:Haloacid dehalogenase-like hydrolase
VLLPVLLLLLRSLLPVVDADTGILTVLSQLLSQSLPLLTGVLTASPLVVIAQFEADHGIPPGYIAVALSAHGAQQSLFHKLERGEEQLSANFLRNFETELNSELSKRAYAEKLQLSANSYRTDSYRTEGFRVDAPALMSAIAACTQRPVPLMRAAAEAARANGLKIAVVSNDFKCAPGFSLPVDHPSSAVATVSDSTDVTAFETADRVTDNGLLSLPETSESVIAARTAAAATVAVTAAVAAVEPHNSVYHSLAEISDVVVRSSTVGVRKPEHAIYTLALARLGVQPNEAVLIDDIKGNLKAACTLGIATVWCKPGGVVRDVVAELERVVGVRLQLRNSRL